MTEEGGRTARWLQALQSRVRLGKFVSVGAVGAVFDTTVLLVLSQFLGVLEEIAVLAGIETSILVMFALNEYWTYPDSGEQGRIATLRRLVRSHLVRSGGITVQFAVFVLIYRVLFAPVTLFGLDLWLLVAKGAGILFGMSVNYVFETLFTWRVQQS
ncbi:GtrA family protein [Halobacteriaceae archaeon SHR40]|uniref:GtrA family protein n=1 Tax=Halovenus amylolytica TaxID=2500550 RepID=UPI000FE387BD